MRRITEKDRESNLPPKSSIFSCSSIEKDMDLPDLPKLLRKAFLIFCRFSIFKLASTPIKKRPSFFIQLPRILRISFLFL